MRRDYDGHYDRCGFAATPQTVSGAPLAKTLTAALREIMDQTLTAPADRRLPDATRGTLQRWLTGPRVDGLPQLAALPAPALSFEFFPPKNDALETQLWSCIRRLEPLAPHRTTGWCWTPAGPA